MIADLDSELNETRCARRQIRRPWAKNAQKSVKASPVLQTTATTAHTALAMGFKRKSEKKSGLTRKKIDLKS